MRASQLNLISLIGDHSLTGAGGLVAPPVAYAALCAASLFKMSLT